MTSTPPRWTAEELVDCAAISAARFRADRLAISNSWEMHYGQARAKFELLFQQLNDLDAASITDENLAEIQRLELGEALRYLAGPPISSDDLQVLADVDSLAAGVLRKSPESLRKVYRVIEQVIDRHRFPWIDGTRTPTQREREAALLASSVLLAAQRIATERRNEGKENQETTVRNYLCGSGFRQFGVAQVVPAAVLAGVFNVLNLKQAQERGLSLFWSHDLESLGAFIESTR